MNRRLALLSNLLPMLLMISGCNQGAAPADSSVITSRSEAWETAFNATDMDALVALYETDARLLPPNAEMTSGSDALRAEFGAMIDAGLSVELTSVEAMVSGDFGYNVGVYTLMSGDTQVDVGKYMEIWHRGADGQWRYSNDMFSSDMPAAVPERTPRAHLMITHEVEDADKWMAAWRGDDSRHQLFKNNGAAHVHTFQNADSPNQTGLVISVTDMDAINAMLTSEEGQAAAATDGVKVDTMQLLTETK